MPPQKMQPKKMTIIWYIYAIFKKREMKENTNMTWQLIGQLYGLWERICKMSIAKPKEKHLLLCISQNVTRKSNFSCSNLLFSINLRTDHSIIKHGCPCGHLRRRRVPYRPYIFNVNTIHHFSHKSLTWKRQVKRTKKTLKLS